MARSPDIFPEHGTDFRRFVREGKKFHERNAPRRKKVDPNPQSWEEADPNKYYGFDRTILKGCELPEGVLPENALETSRPPLKTKVRIELRILIMRLSKIANSKR